MKKGRKMVNNMYLFEPDYIVETTNVCNMQCPGCYAKNVNEMDNNKIYLTPQKFLLKLNNIKEKYNKSIALRGGEPTLSPYIDDILKLSYCFKNTYLETNGLWVLDIEKYSSLVDKVLDYNIIVKLSFDRMHSSLPKTVNKIIKKLEHLNICFEIAITAKNLNEYMEIKQELHIPKYVKTYFQKFLDSKQKIIDTYDILELN